ncbi:uncharacterized protein IWZ02DRAFT_455894 [Phyllosticta citriasiana]|uniref:uncharacterized protein n=1 Tax=Phyllosticta citriasiana TaxID=595635 RepID=UPI0030FDC56A
MVLYISKPLWKSFKSDKDELCNPSSIGTQPPKTSDLQQTTNTRPSRADVKSTTATQRSRSQTPGCPQGKRVGPKIRIIAPPSDPIIAPGTHPDDLVPKEPHLLAAPQHVSRKITRVLAASDSPATLRAVSPVEFLPSLSALSPTRSSTRYAMSTSTSSSRGGPLGLCRRSKHFILLPDGRTRTEGVRATTLRRATSLSLNLRHRLRRIHDGMHNGNKNKPPSSTSSSAREVALNPHRIASPDRRRAKGAWVRDRQGNPFWMNGICDGQTVDTAPLAVVVDRKGTPEFVVVSEAFASEKEARLKKVRMFL